MDSKSKVSNEPAVSKNAFFVPIRVRFTIPRPIQLPKDYPVNPQTFGQHLKKARLDKSLTQKELANLCGIDYNTIRHYEKDHWLPPRAVICKLNSALNVSLPIYKDTDPAIENPYVVKEQSFGIRLSTEMSKKLKFYADKNKISKSAVIQNALKTYLTKITSNQMDLPFDKIILKKQGFVKRYFYLRPEVLEQLYQVSKATGFRKVEIVRMVLIEHLNSV